MAEEKNMAQSKTAFATLCQALDKHEWHFENNEEKLPIECSAQGEDLPIKITVKVDSDRMLIVLLSHLPPVFKRVIALMLQLQ